MVRSLQDKIGIVAAYFENHRSSHATERYFNNLHPDRPICRRYIKDLIQKFSTTGSVQDKKRTGRPTFPEEKQIEIIGEVVTTPQQALSTVAQNCDVSPSYVHKLLKKHKFHPYKFKMVHKLTEDDPDRRNEFCETMTEIIGINFNYISKICFSDECTFFLNDMVNRQNVRYWSDVNPHVFRETSTQFPQRINVWAGILGNHIVGPIFLQENLTGPLYLEMLQQDIVPQIQQIVEQNPNEFPEEIIFQQDGAPPHFARPVREFLNNTFPNRWIGRRGATEWPARSPDLTPMDFFLWGYLKSKVYITEPQTIEELREKIIGACNSITNETFHKVREEFRSRLYHCLTVQGEHFEHLLK